MTKTKKSADRLTPHQRRARAEKAHRAGGTGKIAGYPVHPAAAELPLMPETELSELAASIKANGQRFPVMLHEGKVVDGRNRLLACEIAGVTPRTSELGNTGLVEFIADANLRRRQLKQDQRAAIAARLVRHYKSEAAKAPKPGKKSAPGAESRKVPTVAEVAQSHGLGKRTVERALEVEKKSPELLDKVLKGEHTLKEAERHVTRGTTGEADKNERFTPRWLIEELHRYYKFNVDAAGHAKAPATDVIKLWWGRKENGLEQSWRGKRVWCNPPFDECEAWVEKAVREVKEGGCPLVLMLMPAVRTEQDWFQDNIELHRDYYQTWEAAKAANDGVLVTTRFLRGRTRFGYPNDPEGEHSGSPEFGCVLVLFTTEAVQDLRALTGLVEPKEEKTIADRVVDKMIEDGRREIVHGAPKLDFARELNVAGFTINEKRAEINCVVCAQWWPLLQPLASMTKATFDAFMHHANEHGQRPKASDSSASNEATKQEEPPLDDGKRCGLMGARNACVRELGHAGDHRDFQGLTWQDKAHRTLLRGARKKKAGGVERKSLEERAASGKGICQAKGCFSKSGAFGLDDLCSVHELLDKPEAEKIVSEVAQSIKVKANNSTLLGELPFSVRCSVTDCKSDAALGEEKCAAHLVAEEDAAEPAKPEGKAHVWQKVNLVTRKDMTDLYRCDGCQREYVRHGVSWNPPAGECTPNVNPRTGKPRRMDARR